MTKTTQPRHAASLAPDYRQERPLRPPR